VTGLRAQRDTHDVPTLGIYLHAITRIPYRPEVRYLPRREGCPCSLWQEAA
jgi:hypothetical protein